MYNDQAELIDKIDQNEEIMSAVGYDQNQIVLSTSNREIIYYDLRFKKQKRKIQVLSKIRNQIESI